MRAVFLATVLLTLVVATRADACTCAPPRPPLKALALADAVFSGEIIDITPKSHEVPDEEMADGFRATVKVIKSWKGNVAGTVTVRTGTGFGDCGIDFQKGAWLFYAYHRKNGEWYTGACDRTAFLEGTGEETYELDGHLPALNTPARKPLLELRGKINDAGYDGYIFTLRNRLHDRIFYYDYQFVGRWIQVLRHGHWIDYSPDSFTPASDLTPATAAGIFAKFRRFYDKYQAANAAVFLNRASDTTIFVGKSGQGMTWRVGFQYLREQELDSGKKIQRSKHYVWSEPIRPDTAMKTLSFKEAFADLPGAIANPLGTTVSDGH